MGLLAFLNAINLYYLSTFVSLNFHQQREEHRETFMICFSPNVYNDFRNLIWLNGKVKCPVGYGYTEKLAFFYAPNKNVNKTVLAIKL